MTTASRVLCHNDEFYPVVYWGGIRGYTPCTNLRVFWQRILTSVIINKQALRHAPLHIPTSIFSNTPLVLPITNAGFYAEITLYLRYSDASCPPYFIGWRSATDDQWTSVVEFGTVTPISVGLPCFTVNSYRQCSAKQAADIACFHR